MSSPYPILGDRPIDQWKVTELKDELRRRKLVTKGLKEDLVKRLDEAIRNEQESLNKDNGFGLVLQTVSGDERDEVHISENSQNTTNVSDTVSQDKNVHMNPEITCEQESRNLIVSERDISEDSENSVNTSHPNNMERNVDLHPPVNYGQENSNLFISERAKGGTNPMNEKANHNMLIVDINDSIGSIEKEKVTEGEHVDGSDSTGFEGREVATVAEASELVSEDLEPVTTLSGEDLPSIGYQNKISDVKTELENGDPKLLHVDAKDDTLETNNQVSEVNPVLGFPVKCESISTETVSIIEKIELKDNIITDDVKLELDVKPEMVQPSSNSDVPEGGNPHLIDVEEPHANVVSVEETGGGIAESVDIVPKNVTGELSASGKVNLNRGSSDDFMEEDMTESKQMDSKTASDEMKTDGGKDEASAIKDEGVVDIVGKDISVEKVFDAESNNGPAAPPVKRKLKDQVAAGNTDVARRQRRWNSDALKVPEARAGDVVSTTPRDVFQPAFKPSFSKLDPAISEEAPKERVVPPSTKPPTNSLRIDRFQRPFTLKAVQELLGKTGAITNFWMDHIKTHCYVSYSSVEEAVETRNAVYNLQWPPNGGRFLVAEFVDPQEVTARLEAPPQSPATQVSSGARNGQQAQPPQRLTVPKQQLLQPPPPPPPMLSNPPPVREQLPPPVMDHLPPPPREHLPPVKERLTLLPPPPPPEKAEPPIVTLDDLFRKTKATPRIYYLPLSDEQAAAKLQSQGKAVNH